MKFLSMLFLMVFLVVSCINSSGEGMVLAEYPVDGPDGLITQSGIVFDKMISSDGNGSLKIIAETPEIVQLYETGNLDVESATLIYSANVKTDNVQGQVYLEMWCAFNDKGEYFSRGLDKSVAGTADWKRIETRFFLNANENPDNIRLNIVVAGTGTVWIDDLKLVKI